MSGFIYSDLACPTGIELLYEVKIRQTLDVSELSLSGDNDFTSMHLDAYLSAGAGLTSIPRQADWHA